MDRREEILAAAKRVAERDGPGKLSVRAVAAEAGIGASTLRHYFPTQAELHQSLLEANYQSHFSDLNIADTDRPALERLTECLNQFLPPLQPRSREAWLALMTSLLGPESSTENERLWAMVVGAALGRIAAWLRSLDAEGVLRPGGPDRHARFLLALLDGLDQWRIMPGHELSPEHLQQALEDGVAAVLLDPGR